MNKIQQEIRKLNRKVLSQVETELDVLKGNHPEVEDVINNIYRRLRKNILDTIGDCERAILEDD